MLCCRSCTATCTWKRFTDGSFQGTRLRGGRAGASAAAVFGQEADQLVHGGEIRAVDDEAAVLAAACEPGSCEVSEVEGKRGGGKLERFTDRPRGEALRPRLDQEAEHPKPRFMCQGRQGVDDLRMFHISRIVEI